jgi:predicted dehydrogenase
MNTPKLPRRTFLKTVGAAGLAFPFISRSLFAAQPSKVLRHASFGASGMAWSDIQAIASNKFVKLVAVADVDLDKVADVKAMFPDVRVYQDWRQLLDKEGNNIDSCNVSTPDHMHAPIAYSAMQLGKHIYCQKPLAHDIYETRVLTEFAREKKLITQMGIQIHSQKVYRQAVAIVHSGAIGKVKEVHTWSGKKWGDVGAPPAPTGDVSANFNWDLWLGNAAERPYVGKTLKEPDGYYHPSNWRKRLDFGTGTFGDMGCHIFDPVFESLALTAPLSVRSEGPAPDQWNWATDAISHYVFPGTKYTADKTVRVTWYDGDQRPPSEIHALVAAPKDSSATVTAVAGLPKRKAHGVEPDQGSILIGTEGVLFIPHIATPRLFPREKFADYKLPEVAGSHHWSDWAEAIVGGPAKPLAPFDYSGPLTEAVLLGSVAVRFPKTDLKWNAAKLEFENEKSANTHVRRTYRKGWEIAGL